MHRSQVTVCLLAVLSFVALLPMNKAVARRGGYADAFSRHAGSTTKGSAVKRGKALYSPGAEHRSSVATDKLTELGFSDSGTVGKPSEIRDAAKASALKKKTVRSSYRHRSRGGGRRGGRR